MQLPNAEGAIIAREKLENYLLSGSHPLGLGLGLGRFKAAFFSRLGLRADRWRDLERAFRDLAVSQSAETAERTESGQ